MKITSRNKLIAAAMVSALMAPAASYATNGYFAHGYGTKNKGMAGSGVAFTQDSLASATNPAGMVWVGSRMDLGAAIFSPMREYTESNAATGMAGGFVVPGSQDSDSNFFLVPHFGYNKMWGNDSSIGVSVYGNGGMNTDYPNSPWNGGSGSSGVDLSQLFIVPTYSKKINDKSSWGVGAVLAVQRFQARGLAVFGTYSVDSANLTDNGHDVSYGLGLKLGWQGEVAPNLTLGAAVTSRIYMSKLDDYAGLFAEGGDFDIPPQFTLGLAYKTSNNSVITADVQHIMYSDIDSVGNSIRNLTSCPAFGGADSSYCFGGSNGPGFGWDDMTIVKVGYQWQTGSDWTWRVGASYGEQPISQTTLNILAPAVIETHLTFGFTKKTSADSEFNFAAMYAPSNKKTATSALGLNDNISLEMDQFELEASWAWKF